MQYCAWNARLDARDAKGFPARAHLESSAQRGDSEAAAALTPPPFPHAVEHLWQWHRELQRGLGRDMHGAAPLTWAALDAWARWAGAKPYPHEVDVLFGLDVIARNPHQVLVDAPTAATPS